jgi:hypothetical protein
MSLGVVNAAVSAGAALDEVLVCLLLDFVFLLEGDAGASDDDVGAGAIQPLLASEELSVVESESESEL